MILEPGHKPEEMTLWFHPSFMFPDKNDIMQIPDSNGEYTSYRVMSTNPGKRQAVLKRTDKTDADQNGAKEKRLDLP